MNEAREELNRGFFSPQFGEQPARLERRLSRGNPERVSGYILTHVSARVIVAPLQL